MCGASTGAGLISNAIAHIAGAGLISVSDASALIVGGNDFRGSPVEPDGRTWATVFRTRRNSGNQQEKNKVSHHFDVSAHL